MNSLIKAPINKKTDILSKNCVLFLTNNEITNKICLELKKKGENIVIFSDKLTLKIINELEPCFIVSYNYKYIVSEYILNEIKDKIINCHISYLPYNRGASPNFFSFYENTPKGITIHIMDKGLDTGEILLQKELIFDENKETFLSSYNKLIEEMNRLILDNWEALKNCKIKSVIQPEYGTKHTKKDLEIIKEKYPFLWTDLIGKWKEKYRLK